MTGRRGWGGLVVVGAVFFVASLLAVGDYGVTYDEFETYRTGSENLAFLTGERGDLPTSSDFHVIPGYSFVFDTVRALFARLVQPSPDIRGEVVAHHLFNVLVSTSSIALLYLLVWELTAAWRFATFAASALALTPQFIGHSQNNPKDLPVVFVFLLTVFLVVRLTHRPSGPRALAVALALGLGLTTHPLSSFLVPIAALWVLVSRRAIRLRPWHSLVALGAGGLSAFLFWPWLWDDPVGRLSLAIERVQAETAARYTLLYLGKIYTWTEVPWHYRAVHLLASLPIVLIALALLSAAALAAWRRSKPSHAAVLELGLIWVAVFFIADQLATVRYCGFRHLLAVLPGVAILIAGGAEWLTEVLGRRLLPWTVVLAAFGLIGAEIVRVHPYQTAYVNQVAGLVGGPHTEEWLEVEYWGHPYKEGAEWINRQTEPEALVHVPIADFVAGTYLEREVSAGTDLARFQDESRPQYLMFIARPARYDDLILHVRALYQPVFSIRRQRSTLLEVYSNRSPGS